jgi:hypothetical protein
MDVLGLPSFHFRWFDGVDLSHASKLAPDADIVPDGYRSMMKE